MSGYPLPSLSVSLSCSLPFSGDFGPGLQLFIYPLRPHIYTAITPKDVINSLSTPQLSVVAPKGKSWTWGGASSRFKGFIEAVCVPMTKT